LRHWLGENALEGIESLMIKLLLLFQQPHRLIITFCAYTMGLAARDLLFLASRALRRGNHMVGVLALRSLGWALHFG
jgi:hypothetical protein